MINFGKIQLSFEQTQFTIYIFIFIIPKCSQQVSSSSLSTASSTHMTLIFILLRQQQHNTLFIRPNFSATRNLFIFCFRKIGWDIHEGISNPLEFWNCDVTRWRKKIIWLKIASAFFLRYMLVSLACIHRDISLMGKRKLLFIHFIFFSHEFNSYIEACNKKSIKMGI